MCQYQLLLIRPCVFFFSTNCLLYGHVSSSTVPTICCMTMYLLQYQLCVVRPCIFFFSTNCLLYGHVSSSLVPTVCCTAMCLLQYQLFVVRPCVFFSTNCLLYGHVSSSSVPTVCCTAMCLLLQYQLFVVRPCIVYRNNGMCTYIRWRCVCFSTNCLLYKHLPSSVQTACYANIRLLQFKLLVTQPCDTVFFRRNNSRF